jgi:hypothetical protein
VGKRCSKKQRFYMHTCERAGVVLLEFGESSLAKGRFVQASKLYHEWGAVKVERGCAEIE